MKKVYRTLDLIEKSTFTRQDVYQFYLNKYFNLYMNSFKWNGLDYQQIDFLMRRFWADGRIAAFMLKGKDNRPITNEEHPNGVLVFTPYAPSTFNLYDYPVDVTLINKRGVNFIPTTLQRVDEDVVLGYAQRNKKSVFALVDFYIKKIVDIEMTIKTNLKAQKTPWLIGVSAESENKMNNLRDNLDEDEPYLFLNLEETNNAKSLLSGAPYTIDKLYNQKCAYENELREYLGINNMGVNEKKEHLITSEIDNNNQMTSCSEDCFYDVANEFCERIKKVFGYEISVELNRPEEEVYIDEGDNEDENN